MSDESIVRKIIETKRQTEELKNQLQNLIDEGKNLVCPSQSKSDLLSNKNEAKPLKSPNNVQIIKSYENKHSKQKSDQNIPKKTENADSPKKSRTYDVEEARKYIKKQKEKRLEQSKVQNESKINAEIQKKKLQELHKKSLILLAQNVRAKRERSKSRDKNKYVRPNETSLTSNIGNAKSMDRIDSTAADKRRNPNLLYPPSPDFKNKTHPNMRGVVNKCHPEKIVILAGNVTRKENKKQSSTRRSRQAPENILDKKINETFHAENMVNREEFNNENIDEFTTKTNKIGSSEQLRPRNLFNTNINDIMFDTQVPQSVKSSGDSVRNILDYKSQHTSNITIRSPNDIKAEKINQTCAPNLIPDGIEKHSKEIQTEIINKDCPKWLEEQPPQAYPFNFINTVTRKLQVANNQKLKTDVGIQNSLITPIPIEKTETLPFNNNQDNSKKDLKSFLSHTCLNLDPAGIEHLELLPKKTCNTQKLPTQMADTESESDTSKNIPEISSESGTSLKKNKESVKKASTLNRNLAISTEKIDNMKLVPHSVCSTRSESQILSESKLGKNNNSGQKYGSKLSVDNAYGSDFDSDIEGESSLNRSRRSIISFNRSGYNKITVANVESLSDISSPRSQMSHNKNASSINTDILMASNISKSRNTEKNGSVFSSPKQIKESGDDEHLKSKTFSSTSKESNFESVDAKKKETSEKINNITSDDQIVTSSKNSETQLSGTVITNTSRSDLSTKNINTRRGSASESERSNILPLSEPKVTLIKDSERVKSQSNTRSSQIVKNLSVRSSKVSTKADAKDANQIHLKFEAEIHLLNDFNESLRRFSALEQALETLKTNNTVNCKNFQNADAKTSSKTVSKISENLVRSKESQISQINFSRGSFINTSIGEDLSNLGNFSFDKNNTSILSTGLEVSNLNSINESMSVHCEDHLSNFENLQSVNFAGLSLNIFEQLIKDEDTRLENLKTILKIREQALLDRTKGELAWLEIQRKHFKETGKLHEASVIKKKQRAILVNHQKEKHEMQRLKQMQKAASIERKIVLKGQHNLIRQQLSTENMLTKMKVNVPRERRLSGPLKVLQSHTESIRSETSITKRSSSDREKDVYSITSHHSTTHHSIVSEVSEIDGPSKEVPSLERQNCIKRTLLMREEALKKRRKAAEELLQWHTKLLEEEKRIAVLESAASAIISQKPSTSTSQEKFNFKGIQLNQLWLNLTGSEGKKFVDDKIYPMSQLALERFCKSAREYSLQTKTLLKKSSEHDISVSDNIPTKKSSSDKDYVSDFEIESSPAAEEPNIVDQSIDILIDNFNQIQDDISTLNITQSRKSDKIVSCQLDKTEISVIETNRTDNKETIDENISEIGSSKDCLESDELRTPVMENVDVENNSESLKIKVQDLEPVSVIAENTLNSSRTPKSNSLSNIELIIKDLPVDEDKQEVLSDHSLEISSQHKTLSDEESVGDKSVIQKKCVEDNIEIEEVVIPVSSETKESLNESQEILSILGGSEVKTCSDEEIVDIHLKDNLTESEEILSKLSQIITVEISSPEDRKKLETEKINSPLESAIYKKSETETKESLESIDCNKSETEANGSYLESADRKKSETISTDTSLESDYKKSETKTTGSPLESADISDQDMLSESLLRLYVISRSDPKSDTHVLEDIPALEQSITEKEQIVLHREEKIIDKSSKPAEETNEPDEESDESKLAGSDKSNESFIINDVNDDSIKKQEEYSEESEKLSKDSEVKEILDKSEEIKTEESSSKESSKPISNLSYGVIEKPSSEKDSEKRTDKEEVCYEEKEHDSLSSITGGSSSDLSEQQNEIVKNKAMAEENNGMVTTKNNTDVTVDVKKRVSEILADTNASRGDKSPRLQDLYVTTYDLISPANSPERAPSSPIEEHKLVSSIFNSEAEELLRKQLAVEKEIKAITDQQKEQLPLMYIREIPNKPPPPYTPPSPLSLISPLTIIPTAEEIEEITMYSAKILHKAYMSNNLTNVNISNNTLSLISKNISKDCYKFVFNLCKEIAQDHYGQFEEDHSPSWLHIPKKIESSLVKPLDTEGLKIHLIKNLKELLGYQKPSRRENSNVKWFRKKRDHVDEILVTECQQEEKQWTNYQKDELLIKDKITNDIFDSLLNDTAEVYKKLFLKKKS